MCVTLPPFWPTTVVTPSNSPLSPCAGFAFAGAAGDAGGVRVGGAALAPGPEARPISPARRSISRRVEVDVITARSRWSADGVSGFGRTGSIGFLGGEGGSAAFRAAGAGEVGRAAGCAVFTSGLA